MMEDEQSEFGKGLVYCLGLFLGHEMMLDHTIETYRKMREENPELFTDESAVGFWFNGAGDHLFEIQHESAPTKEIQERVAKLQDRVLIWRLPMRAQDSASIEDARWALQEAKDLLRLIDIAHNVPTERGQWE